jgi:GNAT superfamily N-acetyltransferase
MKFQRETLTEAILDEAMPLLEMHYKEIAHYLDIPLVPDRAQYLKMEELGSLRLFTIRDDAGTFHGYAVYFVRHNIHYSTSKQAVQDILFLNPEHRKGRVGYRFIAWCDEQLKLEGVQVVYHHVKTAHNFGPMLERMGYQAIDIIYGRRLDLWELPPPSPQL